MRGFMRWCKSHRILTGILLLVALFVIIGASGGSKNASKQSDQSAHTATAPATTSSESKSTVQPPQASTVSSAATLPILTGYGALQQDWNSHHQQDTNYAQNEVYDPTPGLGTDSTHTDKYYGLTTSSGRITGYQMRLPNQQPLAAAQQEVMQEFPSDAQILWQNAVSTDPTNACYEMEIKSPTLGEALADKAIGDPTGEVYVEFSTETAQNGNNNSSYSSSNVNSSLLELLAYPTPADASGC